jgi:POT family proton-dependent oligopeptide transporter
VPATVFQSVNPALIVILAPIFSMIWAGLDKRRIEPSVPAKFALGLMQLGLGFLILSLGAYLVSAREVPVFLEEENREVIMMAAVVPLFILFLGYLFHTTGELCLSPIGLSMVTKLAPKQIGAMVMGLWFLSTSLSHHFGGLIATLTSRGGGAEVPPGAAAAAAGLLGATEGVDPVLVASYDQLASYVTVFQPIGYVSIASGVVLLMIAPLLRKWMHGVK